jgi:small subunit ribosomal protein S11
MQNKTEQKPDVKHNQKSKQEVRYTPRGRIYLTATFNNTIITVTDEAGKVVYWNSCGKAGFSGTRKSTPFAATSAIEETLKVARDKNGLAEVSVYFKGAGPGRDALLRVLRNSGLEINKLVDLTPIPHDGIRPKKRRRA